MRVEWKRAESNVATALKNRGVNCKVVGTRTSPYDIRTAGGQRIEVKIAHKTPSSGRWNFSIKRNGKMDESHVDAYVFGICGLAPRTRLYVIVKAPVKRGLVSFSLRSLFLHHSKDIGNWDLICKEEKRAKR